MKVDKKKSFESKCLWYFTSTKKNNNSHFWFLRYRGLRPGPGTRQAQLFLLSSSKVLVIGDSGNSVLKFLLNCNCPMMAVEALILFLTVMFSYPTLSFRAWTTSVSTGWSFCGRLSFLGGEVEVYFITQKYLHKQSPPSPPNAHQSCLFLRLVFYWIVVRKSHSTCIFQVHNLLWHLLTEIWPRTVFLHMHFIYWDVKYFMD